MVEGQRAEPGAGGHLEPADGLVPVRYRLTEPDFVAAQKLALRELLRGPLLSLLAIGFLIAAVGTELTSPPDVGTRLSNLGVLVATLVALLALLWWVLRRMRRTMYLGNPELNGELTVEVLPDRVTFTSPVSTGTSRWEAFSHFIESKDLIVLWRRNRVINVIPKRAFPPGQLERFREVLAAHLPNRRPRGTGSRR